MHLLQKNFFKFYGSIGESDAYFLQGQANVIIYNSSTEKITEEKLVEFLENHASIEDNIFPASGTLCERYNSSGSIKVNRFVIGVFSKSGVAAYLVYVENGKIKNTDDNNDFDFSGFTDYVIDTSTMKQIN